MLRFISPLTLIFSLTLFLTFSTKLVAQESKALVCAHHQLCNLLLELMPRSEHDKVVAKFISENSDPHEVGLPPDLLKTYYKAPKLIIMGEALAPWLPSVLRERNESNTFVAQIQSQDLTGQFPQAFAHFWLYENELCPLKLQLAQSLRNWGYLVKEESQECASARFAILKKKINSHISNKFFVLTHDALAPLLQSLGANFLILRQGGHGHEVSPMVFKTVHQLMNKHSSLVWIIEKEIGLPVQLQQMMRKEDQKIELKVSGYYQQSTFAPLEALAKSLREIENE